MRGREGGCGGALRAFEEETQCRRASDTVKQRRERGGEGKASPVVVVCRDRREVAVLCSFGLRARLTACVYRRMRLVMTVYSSTSSAR